MSAIVNDEPPRSGYTKHLIFVGIGELLPIYEDIEDGAELMWNDYGFISHRRTMRMPYEKKELLELIKSKQEKNKNCS